jgi:hypothetical protein
MSSNLLDSKEFFPSHSFFIFVFLVCPIAMKIELLVLNFVVKSSIDVMGIQVEPIALFPFFPFPIDFP